ncbi:unnamed protein product [Mycena citricolor]|uniref:D-aminoacyl-tRNA deacylase n=1 Tax=Mycena citricolor TaxID=2018698 RepID=A0AAD2GWX1_9AGAR|nr:unnamed protein product [Mycena citricolor]
MRAVIQRVASASVAVDGQVISHISKGLMVLVGISRGADDTATDVATLTNKILSLRVFPDSQDPSKAWKANVKDIDGEVLCVSQFTLIADTKKGNKPDFHNAMTLSGNYTKPRRYKVRRVRAFERAAVADTTTPDGRFGAMMDVALTNEGPVTFTLDSRKFEYVQDGGGQNRLGTAEGPSEKSIRANVSATAT